MQLSNNFAISLLSFWGYGIRYKHFTFPYSFKHYCIVKRKYIICIFSFHLDSSFMSKSKNTKSFVLFVYTPCHFVRYVCSKLSAHVPTSHCSTTIIVLQRKLTRSLIKYIDKFHIEHRSEERFPLCFIEVEGQRRHLYFN